MEEEQLKPSTIIVQLEQRLAQLQKILSTTQKHLANPVQGHLRVSQKGHNPEFYQITAPGDTHGTYIPRSKLALARRERVRSKSEVIIADTLARHGIPYRYEYPLELKNDRTVHPDFLCLNVRTRAEFYWEHFGLMDDPDYLERTLLKLKSFAENHIIPGKNLIFTMESAACPLSTRQVENLINEFLL